MNKDKKKSHKVLYLIIIIAVILIGIGVFLIMNNQSKPQNNATSTDINYNLDYKDLEKELINKIKKDEMQVYMVSCEEKDGKLNSSNKKLSADSVSVFFNQLNHASTIEEATLEDYCTKYTYILTTDIDDDDKTILAAWYGNDGKTLLFGLNKDGYVAKYEEHELDDFLENLK